MMPALSRADWHLFSLALVVTCGVEVTLGLMFSMLLRLAPDPPFMMWSYGLWSPGLVDSLLAVVIVPILSIFVGLRFLENRLHPKPGVAVVIAFVGSAIASIVALWVVLFLVRMLMRQVNL